MKNITPVVIFLVISSVSKDQLWDKLSNKNYV